MLKDETLKALIEAIIYVSPEPVTLDMLAKALEGESRDRIKGSLYGLLNDYAWPQHGIQIRPVAGGWKFSSKTEHHEVLRGFVKSLKPPVRLSKPALEALSVIAYRQPVTVPEINDIRGVDCGGVIHTLMEKKLVVTAGRKNVVGRPILYRTSRDFLVHFGLRDLGELPSLREFEEMARQALGSDVLPESEVSVAPESNAEPVAAAPEVTADELADPPGEVAEPEISEPGHLSAEPAAAVDNISGANEVAQGDGSSVRETGNAQEEDSAPVKP
ncbi:MAG TPA: SMC-Scp complex subunit ScpB [Terriglobia bacterium]|nr:SMC-Scp complex subunit ScpB [Terriglobia bacterium]